MTVVSFRRPALEIGCSSCGATVDAACDCGVPYMPAGQRAAAAIAAASPEKSNRMIAEEIGVSEPTVRRARASRDAPDRVETRIGKDGKTYRLPTRSQPDDDSDDFEPATPSERRNAFLLFSNQAMLWAKYEGPIDSEIIEVARATAEAWRLLVASMEGKK